MKPPEIDPPDDDLAALFDAERARTQPSAAARERVRARVMATLGPGGGGGPPPSAAPPSPDPGSAAHLLRPILLGAALGSAVVAAVVARPESAPAPLAAITAPSAEAMARPAPAVSGAAPGREGPAPAASVRALPAGRDESLAAERRVLDQALGALAEGRSAASIEALERHARDFPRGRLTEEREALWIRALARSGRRDEARARASRFRETFPRSIMLPAVEATLDTIP